MNWPKVKPERWIALKLFSMRWEWEVGVILVALRVPRNQPFQCVPIVWGWGLYHIYLIPHSKDYNVFCSIIWGLYILKKRITDMPISYLYCIIRNLRGQDRRRVSLVMDFDSKVGKGCNVWRSFLYFIRGNGAITLTYCSFVHVAASSPQTP